MTAITREYLDALLADVPRWASFPPETVLDIASALRRVLDVPRTPMTVPGMTDEWVRWSDVLRALAGTQTDAWFDAACRIADEGIAQADPRDQPAWSPKSDLPAPSSPDRIKAVARNLGLANMELVAHLIAEVDAYDREHQSPEGLPPHMVGDWK